MLPFILQGNLPAADTLAWVRYRDPVVELSNGTLALPEEDTLCHPWLSWTPVTFAPPEECPCEGEISMCMNCMPIWHLKHSIKIGSKKSQFLVIELDSLAL